MAVEFQILDYMQTIHNPMADKIMTGATALGNMGLIWIALTLVLLILPRTRTVGKVLLLALLIEIVLVNLILKPLIHRPRPYVINPGVRLLIEAPVDYSFPSGHTGMAFAVVSGLYLMKRKDLGLAASILATVIAFSRIYLYVHYPTDVLAGILIGLFSGYAGYRIYRYIVTKKYNNKKNNNNDNNNETDIDKAENRDGTSADGPPR